ncbi:MAG TPA: hypothetical protein VNI79_01135 [Sphingomicrobium sp.]|nr:hypothetical protein [Sphingomicrobium sp.]
MRVAILCNGHTLAFWQRQAIADVTESHDFYLLTCDEHPASRKLIGHGLYYALNLVTVRNPMTRGVAFPDPAMTFIDRHHCRPSVEGGWAAFRRKRSIGCATGGSTWSSNSALVCFAFPIR